MNPSWRELMAETNPDALFVGGPGETRFDRAIIGIGTRCGQPALLVYDVGKLVEVYMEMGMSHEEAEEFAEFNTIGAWLGEHTPIFMVCPEPEPPSASALAKLILSSLEVREQTP